MLQFISHDVRQDEDYCEPRVFKCFKCDFEYGVAERHTFVDVHNSNVVVHVCSQCYLSLLLDKQSRKK